MILDDNSHSWYHKLGSAEGQQTQKHIFVEGQQRESPGATAKNPSTCLWLDLSPPGEFE